MPDGQAVARKAGPVGTITIPAKDATNKIKIKKFGIADNASVQFLNQTGGNVSLWIPDGGLLFVPPDGVPSRDIRVDVPAAGRTLSVLASPKDRRYLYSAYCEAIGDFAEGNSAPEIHCP